MYINQLHLIIMVRKNKRIVFVSILLYYLFVDIASLILLLHQSLKSSLGLIKYFALLFLAYLAVRLEVELSDCCVGCWCCCCWDADCEATAPPDGPSNASTSLKERIKFQLLIVLYANFIYLFYGVGKINLHTLFFTYKNKLL